MVNSASQQAIQSDSSPLTYLPTSLAIFRPSRSKVALRKSCTRYELQTMPHLNSTNRSHNSRLLPTFTL